MSIMSIWGKILLIIVGFLAMTLRTYWTATKPKDGKKYFDYKYNIFAHSFTVVVTVILFVMLIVKG